jgi:hypothetical protein
LGKVWQESKVIEVLLVYIGLALFISIVTIKEDMLDKKIAQGFNPNARDGDKDGIIQEGTKWERKVKNEN